jgi:hypothetical protein
MSKSLAVGVLLGVLCCSVSRAGDPHRNPRVLIASAPPAGALSHAGAEDGSDQHPFRTIQAAVDVASPGDTVRVKRGVYHNPGFGTSETNGPAVLIKNGGNAEDGNLTLLGEPGVVIEYDGAGGILGAPNVSYITISNFVIKGPAAGISESLALLHRLDNPALSKYNGQGIGFPGPSHHIDVSNNAVMDACGSGIRVNQGDYISIQGNRARVLVLPATWASARSAAAWRNERLYMKTSARFARPTVRSSRSGGPLDYVV